MPLDFSKGFGGGRQPVAPAVGSLPSGGGGGGGGSGLLGRFIANKLASKIEEQQLEKQAEAFEAAAKIINDPDAFNTRDVYPVDYSVQSGLRNVVAMEGLPQEIGPSPSGGPMDNINIQNAAMKERLAAAMSKVAGDDEEAQLAGDMYASSLMSPRTVHVIKPEYLMAVRNTLVQAGMAPSQIDHFVEGRISNAGRYMSEEHLQNSLYAESSKRLKDFVSLYKEGSTVNVYPAQKNDAVAATRTSHRDFSGVTVNGLPHKAWGDMAEIDIHLDRDVHGNAEFWHNTVGDAKVGGQYRWGAGLEFSPSSRQATAEEWAERKALSDTINNLPKPAVAKIIGMFMYPTATPDEASRLGFNYLNEAAGLIEAGGVAPTNNEAGTIDEASGGPSPESALKTWQRY